MDDSRLMGGKEGQKELQRFNTSVTSLWNWDLTSVQELSSRKGKHSDTSANE